MYLYRVPVRNFKNVVQYTESAKSEKNVAQICSFSPCVLWELDTFSSFLLRFDYYSLVCHLLVWFVHLFETKKDIFCNKTALHHCGKVFVFSNVLHSLLVVVVSSILMFNSKNDVQLLMFTEIQSISSFVLRRKSWLFFGSWDFFTKIKSTNRNFPSSVILWQFFFKKMK